MYKSLKMLGIASLLAVSACATGFRADVARFQQLPPAQGETFYVQASDPKLQGGIEFNQYAQMVTARMVQQGYQPASSPSNAALRVTIDYDVDTGRERVVSTGFGGGYGFGYPYRWGARRAWLYGFHDPFAWGPGYGDVSSYTIYTSELDMQIERAGSGERLFEGTARARSRDDDLQYLVPNLIDAMFAGFPGRSGETVNITLPPRR
ncbi:DUF4136 domain-containing protein [Sphingomonas gilva]|uniref:DUF4136 domain-containing protein n=1 Tax=Sphingomonas gilva TaxID=2305907 RepID=A0A396RJH0_9SPHN|nr:DUF4136 domain-containing protein [Sphingomonas gilva]RHW16294.1 DUF4136 domain-containing protein [Sphingomonas gilva]